MNCFSQEHLYTYFVSVVRSYDGTIKRLTCGHAKLIIPTLSYYVILSVVMLRDVSTGATGATAVTPKFSDTLTLFQPGGGQILPTIGAVAPKFFLWLRPCNKTNDLNQRDSLITLI